MATSIALERPPPPQPTAFPDSAEMLKCRRAIEGRHSRRRHNSAQFGTIHLHRCARKRNSQLQMLAQHRPVRYTKQPLRKKHSRQRGSAGRATHSSCVGQRFESARWLQNLCRSAREKLADLFFFNDPDRPRCVLQSANCLRMPNSQVLKFAAPWPRFGNRWEFRAVAIERREIDGSFEHPGK